MDFQEIIDINRKVATEFAKTEPKPWTAEAITIELVKQVGDLSKAVMAVEGFYTPKAAATHSLNLDNVKDEIGDIFLMLTRLSDKYKLNMEESILEARRGELKFLSKESEINF